jgi:hypothetical protein
MEILTEQTYKYVMKNIHLAGYDTEMEKEEKEPIEGISEKILIYTKNKPNNIKIFYDYNYTHSIPGEFMIFYLLGQQQERYNKIHSECILQSIKEKIKNTPRGNYNIIYPIGIVGYYNNDSTQVPDYFHSGILIICKRDTQYTFFRYDPWGQASYLGGGLNANVSEKIYDLAFEAIFKETVIKLNGTFHKYVGPRAMGPDIQGAIENLNFTRSKGLCMVIATYIAYLLITSLEQDPNYNYNDITLTIRSHTTNIHRLITSNSLLFTQYFSNFCRVGSYIFEKYKTNFNLYISSKNYNNILKYQGHTIKDVVIDKDTFFYHPENMVIYAVEYLYKILYPDVIIRSLDYSQKYLAINHILETRFYDKKFIFPIEVMKSIKLNLLLGLSEYNFPYLWTRFQLFFDQEEIRGFYKNKKYKEELQYCNNLNICKNGLSCKETNDRFMDPVGVFNKKITLDNKICLREDNKYVPRNFNDEEKLQQYFIQHLKDTVNNINRLYNNSDGLSVLKGAFQTLQYIDVNQILDIDRRFKTIINQTKDILNIILRQQISINQNFNSIFENLLMIYRIAIDNIELTRNNPIFVNFIIYVVLALNILHPIVRNKPFPLFQ